MLDPMDWIFVGFLGLLAIALAVAIGIALDRDRQLEAARAAIARAGLGLGATGSDGALLGLDGDPDPATDVSTLIRRLRDRLDASEFELDQQVRNASYLADLMGVGIVRLDDHATVELANAAAHILLRRPPGSLRGRTAIEAFLDGRVEELIAAARASGAASGEFRLSGPEGPILVVRARRSPISGVWVVLEDVSELRRLQQIRTEFVDNLSHELRTPLSTVSLLAETLARDAEAAGVGVPPRMRDRIDKIEVETGPSRPDGQRAARSRPDRRWRPARAARRRGPRTGGHGRGRAASAVRRAAGPAAHRRRCRATAARPRRRVAARPGRRQPRPQRGQVRAGGGSRRR